MKYKQANVPIDPALLETPDYVSNEYFSTQSLKRAVWQYLIDHSTPIDETYFKFNLFTPIDEKEFWRRVSARDNGTFKRKELLDFQDKVENRHQEIKRLRLINNRYTALLDSNRAWEMRIKRHKESGTWWQKALLELGTHLSYCQKKCIYLALGIQK